MERRHTSGKDCVIQEGAVVGFLYKDDANQATLGHNVIVRSGSIIYGDVTLGNHIQIGHNTLIREQTKTGDHVTIGTGTVIDGHVSIGNFVSIQSQCYIPTHTVIGDQVFLGPGATLTNDKYPLKMREDYRPLGPVIERNVTIGARAIICPGVRIGEGSFIAAGAVVTGDVPAKSLVVGVPGKIKPLPEKLDEPNIAKAWARFIQTEGEAA